MELRVLGPVEVAAAGRRMEFASARRRSILAVLLAAGGETVSTGRLIDALWGGEPPVSARKSLQSHLSRLRNQLAGIEPAAPEPLATEIDGYRVALDVHELDARTFEELVARARELAAASPGRSIELLDEALGLWRGPAFGELGGAPAIREEAARLEAMRAAAAADHVDARLALGRYDEVVSELEVTVAKDPLGERAYGQLMLALYHGGRQADALATYRGLQERLRDEIGIDPSPVLRDLHERILRQDDQLVAAKPARAPRDAGASPEADAGDARPSGPAGSATWRVGTRQLIGRDADVAELAALAAQDRLVTLTGPGGVGKTRLAEQVAAQVAGLFDDGVVACSLAGVRDEQAFGGAMITALGVQPTGDRSAAQTLVNALGERRLLLLLDNCEHLLEAVSELVDVILDRCPGVSMLATSRERLHLPGERVWQVAPLAVPNDETGPMQLAATPAGALFQARAQAVDPAFSLTQANAAAVADLCRRLDGMPLAIELAAARVQALAPHDLAARLDRRFSLLAGGPRHGAGRHRTLQAVVAWSYDLLEPAEATLFDRLSVFAGRFSLEAAERICAGGSIGDAEVAGLLGDLVDKSMVVVERRDGTLRYRLLDTLREFGASHLVATDDAARLRRAHATYHLELAEELGPSIRGHDERTAVTGIEAAFDDLRSAHAWMVETGDVDGALRLPTALVDYTFYRLRDEITTWARRALTLPDASEDRWYAAALATAALGATSRDECARAHREATQALALARRGSLAAVWALGALCTAALYEGRLEDVLSTAQQHAEVAEHLGDDFHRAFAGVFRVLAPYYRGDREAALEHMPALQASADASGSPTMRAFAYYCRGETHLDTDPQEATTSFESAVELARHVDNALVEGVSLVSLASLRGRRGDTTEALQLFRRVIGHWRRLGDDTHQLTTLRNLVALLAEMGAHDTAAVLHGAVTGGLAPSFGAEARRLAAAWSRIEQRLGAESARLAARRGRSLTTTQMSDIALEGIDALLVA